MSKGQTLRELVTERLTAAAEEIFALFERTIAEYEEELCRAEKEIQRKQRLLDEVNPRVQLLRAGSEAQSPASSPPPFPGLEEKNKRSIEIKEEPEEQRVKEEEEQLPVSAPEFSAVHVKSEVSSLLHQRQTELRGKTPDGDVSFASDTEHSSNIDNDDDWERPVSCSDAPMAEADGERYDQNSELSLEKRPGPETSCTIHDGNESGSDEEVERKKHQCSECGKRFGSKQLLQRHIRVHTGERPYSCSVCNKTFQQKGNLDNHKRTHTGERLSSCSICGKAFARKSHLKVHMRTHTGDKPYSCSLCNKKFAVSTNLNVHMKTHTGEKPYSCSVCDKTFLRKAHLNVHMRTHTGDKPFSCSFCEKSFSQKSNLNAHIRTHAPEKPYSCSLCHKEIAERACLKNTLEHIRTEPRAELKATEG